MMNSVGVCVVMAKGWRIPQQSIRILLLSSGLTRNFFHLLTMKLGTGSSHPKKCLCPFSECRCAIVTSFRINSAGNQCMPKVLTVSELYKFREFGLHLFDKGMRSRSTMSLLDHFLNSLLTGTESYS